MGVVVLGAGGRLGQLLRPRYPGAAAWLTRSDVDLTDAQALRGALRGADAVLCLAGVTPGQPAPMQHNVDLAVHALDAAHAVGAGRVFLFSSAAVYGRQPDALQPLREDGPTGPLIDYGTAKLAMERAAAAHRHPNTVLRLGNVAGADAILAAWRPGFSLDTLDDGTTPRRSYIGPSKLAQVLSILAQADNVPPLMNVAAPGAVQMGALLDAADLAWTPRPATDQTVANVTFDTTRLARCVPFAPQDSTAQGIVADWQGKAP
ncbi:MAG: NAD(P)-dependent oxidoreductase [Pseudomonadota bacterium]